MDNEITYEAYEKIKKYYPHTSSFAYWKDLNRLDNRNLPIVVESEEAFNNELKGILHGNIILLGYNFGVDPQLQKVLDETNCQTAEDYIKMYVKNAGGIFTNQYGGKFARRIFKFAKGTPLEGAYMTDLFKFKKEDQENTHPTGLPTDNGRQLELDDQLIERNIKGLRYEIDEVLNCHQTPKFVCMGTTMFTQKIINALKKEFNTEVYVIPHYASIGLSDIAGQQIVSDLLQELAK